jgi:hypothetical protein
VRNLGELTELRQELRDRVLAQASKFVPQVETAYREMWSRWCREEKLSPIYTNLYDSPSVNREFN